MPRKRTWLLVVGAALLLWLRPWRRLVRRLRTAAPGTADVPHPEAAFTGAEGAPVYTAADDERIGAILDRNSATLERAADEQATAQGLARPAAGATDDEFGAPTFFGAGEAAQTADQIGAAPAYDDEPDAAALGAPAADEGAALLDAPATSRDDEAGTIPASYLNLSADDSGSTLLGSPLEPEPSEAVEADLQAAEVGANAPGRPDNLLVIEGIGPRTSTIVTAAGITSFAQLAATNVEQLRAALANAGAHTVDPSTWPAQARLASEGRWDELNALQARIKNGRIEP